MNWELGIYDDYQDFKWFVTLEFEEIKQQMSKITSDESKQSVIHPTSRNNENFLKTKLTRKPGYIKQGKLKKDKERKKKVAISSNKQICRKRHGISS